MSPRQSQTKNYSASGGISPARRRASFFCLIAAWAMALSSRSSKSAGVSVSSYFKVAISSLAVPTWDSNSVIRSTISFRLLIGRYCLGLYMLAKVASGIWITCEI